MDNIERFLALGLGLMGLLSGVAGFLAWQASKVRKQYAAERDFGHLKNSYDQLSKNVEQLWRQNDARFDSVDRQLDKIEARVNPDRTSPL